MSGFAYFSPDSLVKHRPQRTAARYADNPTTLPVAPAVVKLDAVVISSQKKPVAFDLFNAARIGFGDIN